MFHLLWTWINLYKRLDMMDFSGVCFCRGWDCVVNEWSIIFIKFLSTCCLWSMETGKLILLNSEFLWYTSFTPPSRWSLPNGQNNDVFSGHGRVFFPSQNMVWTESTYIFLKISKWMDKKLTKPRHIHSMYVWNPDRAMEFTITLSMMMTMKRWRWCDDDDAMAWQSE